MRRAMARRVSRSCSGVMSAALQAFGKSAVASSFAPAGSTLSRIFRYS